LEAGEYAALDLSVGPDGIQYVNKGMLQEFSVAGDRIAGEPAAPVRLLEQSFGYTVSDLPAGPVVVQVVDQSSEDDHEAAIIQLSPRSTVEDVVTYLKSPQGPPPFDFAGGMAALEPGGIGYLFLDLQPGTYALVCFVTDPENGLFHWEQGMIQAFNVKAP
jgi:hypothetical protein